MFIARWQIEARFGHKQAALELMRKWEREIGPKVGLAEMDFTLLGGSIGAKEAVIEASHKLPTLAALDSMFEKIAAVPEHAAWGMELEPHVVSGSSRWQIFRLL